MLISQKLQRSRKKWDFVLKILLIWIYELKNKPKSYFCEDLELVKRRNFKWNYITFAAKIRTRIIHFQIQVFYFLFMFLKSTGFEFFAKIMRGNYVYWCSIHISFNPTSHLNWYLINTYGYHTGTPRRIHVDTSKTKSRQISKSFPRTFSMYFRWSKNPRRFHVLFSM